MSQPSPGDADVERHVDEFVSVSHLVEEPGLARIYAYVLRNGPVTVDQIIDDLDSSPWGTEVDLEGLEALGVVVRNDEDSPATYTAEPVSLRIEADGAPFLITPTFMGGVARMDEDDEVRSFVERNGYGRLAVALASAVRELRGEDGPAGEPPVGLGVNEAVADSLSDIASDFRDVDPFFDDI